MTVAPTSPSPPSATSVRWLYRRTVDAAGASHVVLHALNLWWIAAAAAEETIQGTAMASAFLTLFDGHLSTTDTTWLRWREDLATSAEMRRAYSALYGRFFARGMLQHVQGFTNFTPLHTDQTSVGSITVARVETGDIPDWIAWDPAAQVHVLGEAKGNLTGSEGQFRTGTPGCIMNGKDQFERVSVVNSAGAQLWVDGWVGASLWATDQRDRRPVFVAWDPLHKGLRLDGQQAEEEARKMRRAWLASLADGFDEPALREGAGGLGPTVFVYARASAYRAPRSPQQQLARLTPRVDEVIDQPSHEWHAGRYVPAILTRHGLRPMRGRAAVGELLGLQRRAIHEGEPLWFVGLHADAASANARARKPWMSDYGVVTPSGLAVLDLRKVRFGRMR